MSTWLGYYCQMFFAAWAALFYGLSVGWEVFQEWRREFKPFTITMSKDAVYNLTPDMVLSYSSGDGTEKAPNRHATVSAIDYGHGESQSCLVTCRRLSDAGLHPLTSFPLLTIMNLQKFNGSTPASGP